MNGIEDYSPTCLICDSHHGRFDQCHFDPELVESLSQWTFSDSEQTTPFRSLARTTRPSNHRENRVKRNDLWRGTVLAPENSETEKMFIVEFEGTSDGFEQTVESVQSTFVAKVIETEQSIEDFRLEKRGESMDRAESYSPPLIDRDKDGELANRKVDVQAHSRTALNYIDDDVEDVPRQPLIFKNTPSYYSDHRSTLSEGFVTRIGFEDDWADKGALAATTNTLDDMEVPTSHDGQGADNLDPRASFANINQSKIEATCSTSSARKRKAGTLEEPACTANLKEEMTEAPQLTPPSASCNCGCHAVENVKKRPKTGNGLGTGMAVGAVSGALTAAAVVIALLAYVGAE
ncbi:hypothetical protein BJ742DRAFT_823014 [Cladochytrium replicatum]|nr:hypothetical protein BJ742DRAFT_823014 [Cladochytrium replicatum]